MASKYFCEVWAGVEEVVQFGVGNINMDVAIENVIRMLPGLAKSKGFDVEQITAIVICGSDYTDEILREIKEDHS